MKILVLSIVILSITSGLNAGCVKHHPSERVRVIFPWFQVDCNGIKIPVRRASFSGTRATRRPLHLSRRVLWLPQVSWHNRTAADRHKGKTAKCELQVWRGCARREEGRRNSLSVWCPHWKASRQSTWTVVQIFIQIQITEAYSLTFTAHCPSTMQSKFHKLSGNKTHQDTFTILELNSQSSLVTKNHGKVS